MINRLFVLVVFVSFVGLSGCLIGSNTDTRREGTYVAPETLSQIEPGKTRSSWITATLGQPTAKTKLEDGHELWTYSYSETKDTHGYVFLIFGGRHRKVTGGKVFVELEDGTVTRYWRG